MSESLFNILALLLIVYFVLKKNARKAEKNKASRNSTAQSAKPADESRTFPQPLPFDEAAPIVPGGFDAAETDFESFCEYEGATSKQESVSTAPEDETPLHALIHKKIQAKTTELTCPACRLIPEFSQSTLIQAVIAKEILTRPPCAVRRFRPGQRPS